MRIVDDLKRGLSAIADRNYDIQNQLKDRGWGNILIPFAAAPVKLHKDELNIQIRVASSGQFFSLHSPLAIVTHELESAPLLHLLRRQFDADQLGAASFAIQDMNDIDVLVGVQHWPLHTISEAQFIDLIETFIQATFTMLKEVNALAKETPGLQVQS
jgi:hypothetical protein